MLRLILVVGSTLCATLAWAQSPEPTPTEKCQADLTCRSWMVYAGSLKTSRDAVEVESANAKAQAAAWKTQAENWKNSAEQLSKQLGEFRMQQRNAAPPPTPKVTP